MIPVRPSEMRLMHRVAWLEGLAGRSSVVAASEDGEVSLYHLEKRTRTTVPTRRRKLRAVSPHPTKPWLALCDAESKTLCVMTLDGETFFEELAPSSDERRDDDCWPAYDACYFDEAGDYLWSAAAVSAGAIEVELRSTTGWSTRGSLAIQDPFGASTLSFHRTPSPAVVAFWATGGQDGQQIYWLRRERGELVCDAEPKLVNTSPPFYSPRGSHCLIRDKSNALRRFSSPDFREVGSRDKPADEDCYLGHSPCHLDESYALVNSNDGRLFLLALETMNIHDEVVIIGHEPRPVQELYPVLVGETRLCTGITQFERVGDLIVFVSPIKRPLRAGSWEGHLLVVPVSEILRRVSAGG